MQQQIKEYMQQDLSNQIIEWKQKQETPEKAADYHRFLYEVFPENIKTEFRASMARAADHGAVFQALESGSRFQGRFSATRVRWVDDRVLGEDWKDFFHQTSVNDEVKELGPPPGACFGDEDEQPHLGKRLESDWDNDDEEFTLRDAFGSDIDALKQQVTATADSAALWLRSEFLADLTRMRGRSSSDCSDCSTSSSSSISSDDSTASSDSTASDTRTTSRRRSALSMWQMAKQNMATSIAEMMPKTFDGDHLEAAQPDEYDRAIAASATQEFSYATDNCALY